MSDWRLVYSDAAGELHEHPKLVPLGGTFGDTRPLGRLIPLPDGATLCMMPGCTPLACDGSGRHVLLRPGQAYAVGALLPTGFARRFLPAYQKEPGAPHLPLFGYTAVAARNGRLYAAAMPIDHAWTWRPAYFNTPHLPSPVARLRTAH